MAPPRFSRDARVPADEGANPVHLGLESHAADEIEFAPHVLGREGRL
jgi:hypothetical protein